MSSLFRVTFAVRTPHDYSSSDAHIAARLNPMFYDWQVNGPNGNNAGPQTDPNNRPFPRDDYRRPPRTVLVLAASPHPADLIVPLLSNVTLFSNAGVVPNNSNKPLPAEQVEILAVQSVQVGEGLYQ